MHGSGTGTGTSPGTHIADRATNSDRPHDTIYSSTFCRSITCRELLTRSLLHSCGRSLVLVYNSLSKAHATSQYNYAGGLVLIAFNNRLLLSESSGEVNLFLTVLSCSSLSDTTSPNIHMYTQTGHAPIGYP